MAVHKPKEDITEATSIIYTVCALNMEMAEPANHANNGNANSSDKANGVGEPEGWLYTFATSQLSTAVSKLHPYCH